MPPTNSPATSETRQRCEIWTRVMGYHRPVSYFNTGKKAEHYSRKHFEICKEANMSFTQRFAQAAIV